MTDVNSLAGTYINYRSRDTIDSRQMCVCWYEDLFYFIFKSINHLFQVHRPKYFKPPSKTFSTRSRRNW